MKTIMRFSMLTILLLMLFGISVNAEIRTSEEGVVEGFMTAFDLTAEDLTYTSPYINNYYFADYYYGNIGSIRDYNTYGNFTFSGGLNRLRFSAFSCEKNIVGYGIEGTTVGILVYEITEDGLQVLDHNVRRLGASGLYSDKITFGYNRMQYVVVAVREEDSVYSNVYEVTTKEMATKDFLENLEIKFISDEVAPEAVHVFDFPVMTALDF